MAIVHVALHVEFRDRLQTLIDCAHEQDGNFHDRWRQNSDAFTSAAIQGGPFYVHLRIHYHLQLLSHPRLQLISTTKSWFRRRLTIVLYDARSRSAILCVDCLLIDIIAGYNIYGLLNPAAWCANQRMCYVLTHARYDCHMTGCKF